VAGELTRGVDDGVVVLVREELRTEAKERGSVSRSKRSALRVDQAAADTHLLGGAGDGHTTSALLLLGVHVEGEGEGLLAQTGSLLLELVQLTLGDTAQLEDQTASCKAEKGGQQ
jgi:hypothetical protein